MNQVISGCLSNDVKQHLYDTYVKKHYTNDVFCVHMTPIGERITVEVITLDGGKHYHDYKKRSDGVYEPLDMPLNDR